MDNESLLLNSYESQLKLIEKSISDTSSPSKKPTTDHGSISDTPKHTKDNIFTNNSRKFRYIAPPTLTAANLPPINNESEAHASMLMSWYMAGYHTGYYEALKTLKK